MKLLLRMQHADRSDESDALTYEGIEECEDMPKEVKVIDEVQNGDQCGFKVLANDMLESMTYPDQICQPMIVDELERLIDSS